MSVVIERGEEDLELWEKKREDLREQGVRYCLSSYVDVNGINKAKAVGAQSEERDAQLEQQGGGDTTP